MSIIKFETEQWNEVLRLSGKIRIEDFIKWFNQITPQYKYIKEKSVFSKNSKGIWSAKKLPEVNIGEDNLWEKIYFVEHGNFLKGFVFELEKQGFLYWDEYFKYLKSSVKKNINAYMKVYEYAINDIYFSQRNKDFLESDLKVIVDLIKHDNAERMIDITKALLEVGVLDSISLLEALSKLMESVSDKSALYHYKNLNFKIDEKLIINNTKINEKIKNKVLVKNMFEYDELPTIILRKDIKEWSDYYDSSSVVINIVLLEFIDVLKDYKLLEGASYYILRLTGSYFELVCASKNEKEYKQVKIALNFLLDSFKKKRVFEINEFKGELEKLLMTSEIVGSTDKKSKVIKF